ncbi:ABC transporter permease [Klebsiella sp. NPDC088457]
MNWDIIAANFNMYLHGASLTLLLTSISLSVAFVISVLLALARNNAPRLIRGGIFLYTTTFRGTPLLIQLFLIYYGLAQFDLLRTSILWPWLSSPLVCVLLAFILNTTAYTSEIFAGGLRHLPAGEIEAAYAYGMSFPVLARRILFPAMLSRSLSLYGNETIMMLHATSLASTVTLMEVTGVARNISLNYYIQFEPYVTAGAIYLSLTLIMVTAFRYLEKHYACYLNRTHS